MTAEDVIETLSGAVSDVLSEDVYLDMDTPIEDLDLDSLDLMEIVYILEEELDINLEPRMKEIYRSAVQWETIGQAVDYIIEIAG